LSDTRLSALIYEGFYNINVLIFALVSLSCRKYSAPYNPNIITGTFLCLHI